MLGIAKNLEKKILQQLKTILKDDREKYQKFYKEFGLSLKVGIYESQGQKKSELEDLLLFKTSASEDYKTLKEYKEVMKEDDKYIYYATGSSYENIDSMPAVEVMKSEHEIIYLDEHIDEFVIKLMETYDDIKFKNVYDEEISESEEVQDESEKNNQEELFRRMKEIIGDEIVEVKRSNRLKDDASILSYKGDISIEMEKTLSMQPNNPFPIKAQKVLEINTENILYKKLMNALSKNDENTIKTITNVLYNQARLIAGLQVDDIVGFTREYNKLIK